MGFEKDIRAIIKLVRTQRQTLMFSATWPEAIQRLAHDFLNNPVKVRELLPGSFCYWNVGCSPEPQSARESALCFALRAAVYDALSQRRTFRKLADLGRDLMLSSCEWIGTLGCFDPASVDSSLFPLVLRYAYSYVPTVGTMCQLSAGQTMQATFLSYS
jgi:hypothetical protein